MIRKASLQDHDAIWEIFHTVVKTQDTFVFYPKTSRAFFQRFWYGEQIHTYVYEEHGQILGSYFVKANQMDLGNHVANAGYMVNPTARGKQIGRKLCEHSLELAKNQGFLAMQFNFVVSTNKAAVALWQKMGFEIIGTIPHGFRYQNKEMVDAYIMYQAL